MRDTLSIGIIGSRGIPGNYGGFETFAERLSVGLVERGHKVCVYCSALSSNSGERYYNGVRRIILPTISMKGLDKLCYSFLSCIHSIFMSFDVILFLGVSPVVFGWLPRLAARRLAINIDGLEWKRQKWSRFSAFFLKLSERLSGVICHEVITDAKAIQKYFKDAYGRNSTYIAYGADIRRYEDKSVLTKYCLQGRRYFLQVCRLEPENNVDIVIREYCKTETDIPLVIVGDAPYSGVYKARLREMADSRVRFLGGVYGVDYDVIRSNAFCYIHGHEVGGTNPALLEALAAGNCAVVLNVAYNLEVIGDAGLSFSKDPGSLGQVMGEVLQNPELVLEMREKAVERIGERYTWDSIVDQYETLFVRMIRRAEKRQRLSI